MENDAIISRAYVFDKYELAAIDSVLGIYLGLDLAGESFMLMLGLVVANLWIIYDSLYVRT